MQQIPTLLCVSVIGQITTVFLHPRYMCQRTPGHAWTIAPFLKFSSPYVSLSGEATEPATPALPEETQKEDTKETFKESRGTWEG